MKKVVLLLAGLCIVFFAKGQPIIDPSNTPGYDAQKLANIGPGSYTGPSLLADSSDYHPGSVATFTGSGFLPGEQIEMHIVHTLPPSPGTHHQPWTITADANGDFVCTWLVGNDCFGQHLIGTATGLVSGLIASINFTSMCLLLF